MRSCFSGMFLLLNAMPWRDGTTSLLQSARLLLTNAMRLRLSEMRCLRSATPSPIGTRELRQSVSLLLMNSIR